MRRLTISTFVAGMIGAIGLALLLFSGGQTTQAATGIADPITGQVQQVAIAPTPVDLETHAATVTSDPAITGASTSSSAASQCLPQSPPAPSCASAPVVAIGSPQTVTVTKTISNLSGFSNYSVQDTVVWVGAQEAPAGPSLENPCTMTGPTTCQWSGGPAAIAGNLSEYHATCTVTPVGSAGALGAGSSSQTVGPLTTPQTVTFQFTATCTNDSFFDSHNPKQIVLLFEDQITDIDAPDHHVTDSDTTNNTVVPIPLAFWNRNPNFNPAFTMTIDSLDTTGQTSDPNSIPAAHNCVTNQNTSSPPAPLPGLPCEMYQETHIPAGNPLSLPLVITPQHTATTKGFTIIPGQMVANGTVVAYFGFSIDINFGTGCTTTLGAPYPAVALKDGALPDGSTAGDPVAVLGPEGLDSSAPADIANPAVWPTMLNSDPGVATMVAMGAPIQARYTATDPVLGTPVNIMVFNLGAAGYYTLTVTGDPTAAPTPPGTQCTPFDTQTDYLGSVSPGGQVLRTCDDPSNGTNYVFAASFTRADTFEAVTVADAMGCSATATPTPTPTPSPTLKPSPTPTPTPTPSPTLKPSPTVTPASLPRTGGPGDSGGLSTTTLLLMLAFASAVILTAGVSVLTARDKRNR